MSSCAFDSTCAGTCSNICTGTIFGGNNEIKGGNALWSAMESFHHLEHQSRHPLSWKIRSMMQKSSFFIVSTLKGKPIDYYHSTKRGLGSVSDFLTLASDFDDLIYHNHSSSTSSWDSKNSIGKIFSGLSINMASVSHFKDNEDEGILIQKLTSGSNTLMPCGTLASSFVNLPRMINSFRSILRPKSFPSPSLSVHAYHPPKTRSCSSSSVNTSMCLPEATKNARPRSPRSDELDEHRLQNQTDQTTVKALSPQNHGSYRVRNQEAHRFRIHREKQNPHWVANIVSIAKKNGKIRNCIDSRNLNEDCPKDEYTFPSLMS